jgi:hypothetical protein
MIELLSEVQLPLARELVDEKVQDCLRYELIGKWR